MTRLRSITVYCSSSPHLEGHFAETAGRLARAIAARGATLVYGGGGIGLMGVIARSAKAAGARVEGIITEKFLALEQGWDGCDEMVVVSTMRERKRQLAERADAFVILPGGLGTFEEFFEILVARQIGDHHRPIGIVNDRGYYDPMLALIDHSIEHRFVKARMRALLHVHPDPEEVLSLCEREAREGRAAAEYDPQRFLPMGDL
ncbi:MAG: TIGR00730 family Rossman fold protein [Phycisphaerae bacterium]|nr:TIGR00730 family Rossman fold protein [Phycisphaerae bacterium]